MSKNGLVEGFGIRKYIELFGGREEIGKERNENPWGYQLPSFFSVLTFERKEDKRLHTAHEV